MEKDYFEMQALDKRQKLMSAKLTTYKRPWNVMLAKRPKLADREIECTQIFMSDKTSISGEYFLRLDV